MEVKHNSAIATTGEPDLYGSYRGHSFVIEVKLENGALSRIQKYRLKQWGKSGATAIYARWPEEAVRKLLRGYAKHARRFQFDR